MSAVDDIRKLLQDLVTPDLKSLQVRVEALDAKMDAGFKTLDSKIDLTRDLLLVEMKVMQASMETNIAKLNNSLELERRVAKIENAQAAERKDPPTEQRIA
jgi:hypothetical protein